MPEGACLFVLTDSRSLSPDAARELNRKIGGALKCAAAATHRQVAIVSRSDSTLRGHFPVETDALSEVLGPFDGVLLVPFFDTGGSHTIHDVHYLAEGGWLVPVAETPFACDGPF